MSIDVNVTFFFEKLPLLLHHIADNVIVIRAARIPLIKCIYRGYSIDIVCATVALPSPPNATQLLHDSFLSCVSLESRGSVNGIRTVLEIQRLLSISYEVYICALKAIKYWAVRRRVYGSLFGFPNGVTLAIMVARVAQTTHFILPNELFKAFFHFYFDWCAAPNKILPIYITPNITVKPFRIAGMPPCWDVRKTSCRAELLPVLNPAYPYVNAAHNVGRSGLDHFYNEIARVHYILTQESLRSSSLSSSPFSSPCTPSSSTSLTSSSSSSFPVYCILPSQSNILTHEQAHQILLPFSQICTRYIIGHEYDTFVVLHVQVKTANSSANKCHVIFEEWKGFVESKLRMFVYALECKWDVRPHPEAIVIKPSSTYLEEEYQEEEEQEQKEKEEQHQHNEKLCHSYSTETNTSRMRVYTEEVVYYFAIKPKYNNVNNLTETSMPYLQTIDTQCSRKRSRSKSSIQHAEVNIHAAFEEFLYALSETGRTHGSSMFMRDKATMLDPWFKVQCVTDDNFPHDIRC